MREQVNALAELSESTDDLDGAPLAVLRLLSSEPELPQRQLSEMLGLSLAKTHYLLHALLDKGLVKVRNSRRSDRRLANADVLTSNGLPERVRMTRAFLARQEAELDALETTMATLRVELTALERCE